MSGRSPSYRLGDWLVEPELNRLSREGIVRQLEGKTMDVLRYLLEHPDTVVRAEEFLDEIWPGRIVEHSTVHRRINQIRKALADDARNPRYIETISRRGYRLIGAVGEPQAIEETGRQPLSAIAVLPFDDLSEEGGQAWLAEGLAEELTVSLSRIEGLRIPARTSISVLTGQTTDLRDVADRLGVGSLVTGSVRRAGDRINVVASWLRADDQTQLWSARYERTLEDVFALERDIAAGVAEAIRTELGIHDTAEFVSRNRYQTSDVRAWEAFRKGFDLAFTFLPENIAVGRELFEAALELDPGYVEAKAWLAWSDFDHPEERVAGSVEALKERPDLTVALVTLIDDCETQWDLETAERLWDHAIASNPTDNLPTLKGFHLLSGLGRRDDALANARRGVRLDPLWNAQYHFLGRALNNLGRYSEAIEPLRRGIALFHQTGSWGIPLGSFHGALAFAYWCLGMESEARVALLDGYPEFDVEMAAGWRRSGWQGMNKAIAEALLREHRGHPLQHAYEVISVFLLANAEDRSGMYEIFERWMTETERVAVRDREAMRKCEALAENLRSDAQFAPYRDEPRFRELLEQLDARLANGAGRTGYVSLLPGDRTKHARRTSS